MNNTANKGRRLNWRQACECLGCRKTCFYGLIRKGKLTAYGVSGSKRGLWVYEKDCQELLRPIEPFCLVDEEK